MGFVTTTFTTPGACAGVVAVIDVALPNVTSVAAIPLNVTVAPVTKPAPVIVTVVPPTGKPPDGEIEVIVGGATNDLIGPVVVPLVFDATIRK